LATTCKENEQKKDRNNNVNFRPNGRRCLVTPSKRQLDEVEGWWRRWTLKFGLIGTAVSRDSSVGIATGYRLHGPRIEFRCYGIFLHQSRPDLRHTQPPTHWVPGLSRQ
jgi:hypothetical protein